MGPPGKAYLESSGSRGRGWKAETGGSQHQGWGSEMKEEKPGRMGLSSQSELARGWASGHSGLRPDFHEWKHSSMKGHISWVGAFPLFPLCENRGLSSRAQRSGCQVHQDLDVTLQPQACLGLLRGGSPRLFTTGTPRATCV